MPNILIKILYIFMVVLGSLEIVMEAESIVHKIKSKKFRFTVFNFLQGFAGITIVIIGMMGLCRYYA